MGTLCGRRGPLSSLRGRAALVCLPRWPIPAETHEAFCDGHVAAFDFFVLRQHSARGSKIVKGGGACVRKCLPNSKAIICLKYRFGRPGKGNDTDEIE